MKNQFLNTGFTLIELLVTVGLVGVLFIIGISSYLNFSRRQIVIQAARQIVQDLRLAQSLATNNQKPEDCNGTLDGYTFNIPDKIYEIVLNCSNPTYTNTVKESAIFSDLTLSGFTWVKFKVLRQAVECSVSPNPCELTVSGFGTSRKIIVGQGGAISLENE